MSYRAKTIPGEIIRSGSDIYALKNLFRLDAVIGGCHLVSGWSVSARSLAKNRHNPLKAASRARRKIRRAYAKMVLEAK